MRNFQFSIFNFQAERTNGFGLVEIVVAIGIISVSLFALLQTEIAAIKLLRGEKENLEAYLLAEESLEAVRSMRDESWASNIAGVSDNTSYYPVVENGKWKLSSKRRIPAGHAKRVGPDSGWRDPRSRHQKNRRDSRVGKRKYKNSYGLHHEFPHLHIACNRGKNILF